jgi:N-acetylmuramoyl-L-alanine amidase
VFKRYGQILIIIFIALLIVIFDITYENVFTDRKMPSGNKVIIIDAGHGGRDPGAVGKTGAIEKDINLSIGKKLKGYLEENGNTCIMIREVDEGLYAETDSNKKNADLRNRKNMIKDNNADLLISIHLNSFPQSKYYGAQVFYHNGDEKSKRLAKIAQEELVRVLDKNNKRDEKSNNSYYILKDNPVPSILIECGFLSNPEEEKLLQQDDYQNRIAWAIYCGIAKYLIEPQN